MLKVIYYKSISKNYNDLLVSHFEIKKTKNLFIKKYFLLTLRKIVKAYFKKYDIFLVWKVIKHKYYIDF